MLGSKTIPKWTKLRAKSHYLPRLLYQYTQKYTGMLRFYVNVLPVKMRDEQQRDMMTP